MGLWGLMKDGGYVLGLYWGDLNLPSVCVCVGGELSMHSRVLSNIPVLYPPDTRGIFLLAHGQVSP